MNPQSHQPIQFENLPGGSSLRFSTRQLAQAAVLTALAIVLTRFFSSIAIGGGVFRIELGQVPILVSGLLLGPVLGFLVGVVADLLGSLISLQGQFHLGITLTSGLLGLLPGLVFALLAARRLSTWQRLVLGVVLAFVVDFLLGLLLQSLWLAQLFHSPWTVMVQTRAIPVLIRSLVHVPLVAALWKAALHIPGLVAPRRT